MSGSWHLGNDIVDLADRRHAGKAGDRRFLQRVFTPEEQETIQESPDPDHTLWMLWAAKESAFKTVSKFLGTPPTFNHVLFQVTLFGKPAEAPGPDTPPESTPVGGRAIVRRGEVRYGEGLISVRIEVSGSSLHALSWFPDSSGNPPRYSWGWEELAEEEGDWRAAYEHLFSAFEWRCITHRASAMARMAAKRALALSVGAPEGDLEITCDPGTPGRRIPRVSLEGERLEVDLSLSHHGLLVAWAFIPV